MNSNTYSMSDQWTFKFNDNKECYLENEKKGKIIIDNTVKRVIESFHSNTLAEIDQKKLVSRELLEIILKVFYRVGVLILTPGIEPKRTAVDSGSDTDTDTDIDGDGNGDNREENREIKDLSQYPLVSIVIINRVNVDVDVDVDDDEDNHLPELVHSVYRQSYQNRETIIVDRIDTRSKNRKILQLKKQYTDIDILELKRKSGFSKALEKGIKKAGGDFILVLDKHVVLETDALYEMMKIALSRKKWSAISPKLKYNNNPSFIYAIGKSLFPYFGMGVNFSACVDFGQFDDRVESISASFSAALLNRKTIEKIGMADPFYKYFYDDLDWCFRARVQGCPVFNAPGAVVYYNDHHAELTGKKRRRFRTLYPAVNLLYFVIKNLERKSIYRFLKNYIAEDIKNMLNCLTKKQFSLFFAYLRSYLRLVSSIPSLFYKRGTVQRRRKIKEDAAVLAEGAPFNSSLMENGIPKLDTHSLRTYYSFLLCSDLEENVPGKNADTDDIIIWQERTETEGKESGKKLYLEFSFTVKRPGTFDIYLLGFTRKCSKVYLDNFRIDRKTKDHKKNRMLYPAARNIYISRGKHIIELERRNHVREIILRRSHV